MNHSEVRSIFEKKLNEACETIKNTKNADMIVIKPSISYINDKLVEKQTYNGYDNTSLVATAVIFEKNHESDEDPSYEISLLCDLKGGFVRNLAELKNEIDNFDAELERFLKELSSSDDVYDFIKKEDERISSEGEKIVADLEASLSKMKKIGIGVAAVIIGVLLLLKLVI